MNVSVASRPAWEKMTRPPGWLVWFGCVVQRCNTNVCEQIITVAWGLYVHVPCPPTNIIHLVAIHKPCILRLCMLLHLCHSNDANRLGLLPLPRRVCGASTTHVESVMRFVGPCVWCRVSGRCVCVCNRCHNKQSQQSS